MRGQELGGTIFVLGRKVCTLGIGLYVGTKSEELVTLAYCWKLISWTDLS